MKKLILLSITLLLVLAGCDLANKAKREYQRIKHQYEEYVGESKRGPRPFTPIFQDNQEDKESLITASCQNNNKINLVYYETPTDAHENYFSDTKKYLSYPGTGENLKPYWDIRYVNHISTYINGGEHLDYANHGLRTGLDARTGKRNIESGTFASQTDVGAGIAQSSCINGKLAGGTTISLWDAPEQTLTYAGPQSTFVYRFEHTNSTSPWHKKGDGNLMIQANFDTPIYTNFQENIGGGVYFNIFMKNKNSNKFLNYVIGIYAVGEAWGLEKAGIRYDPTTNVVHVATIIKDSSWWSTKSPKSKSLKEVYHTTTKQGSIDNRWDDFFRVNISYQNLLAVLTELKKNPPQEVVGSDFGLAPEEWEVTSIMIQYELEETGGKAIFSGSFRNFEAYTSRLPL